MLRKKTPQLGFLVVAGVGTSFSAHALEPADILVHELGGVYLRPQFDLTEVYTSNTFYEERDEKDNFITYVSPGIDLFKGRIEDNHVLFNYHLTGVHYAQDETSLTGVETEDLNRIDHYLALVNRWEFNRLVLRGDSQVSFLGGLLGTTDATLNRGSIDRIENRHSYTGSFSVTAKSRIALTGSYYGRDLESAATLLDNSWWRTKLGYHYDTFSKTALVGELYYGQNFADPNRNSGANSGGDADSFGGFIGATGDFTAKLTGDVRFGYEHRKANFQGGSRTSDGPVGEVGLTYNISAKSRAQLSYERRFGLSVSSRGSTTTTDKVEFLFNQIVGTSGKLTASFLAALELREYDGGVDDGRTDDYFLVGAGLDYKIQDWLVVGTGYNFTIFETDSLRYGDYDAHRVNLSLQIGY